MRSKQPTPQTCQANRVSNRARNPSATSGSNMERPRTGARKRLLSRETTVAKPPVSTGSLQHPRTEPRDWLFWQIQGWRCSRKVNRPLERRLRQHWTSSPKRGRCMAETCVMGCSPTQPIMANGLTEPTDFSGGEDKDQRRRQLVGASLCCFL